MVAVELAQYLTAQELGVYDDIGTTGNIYINMYPSDPDEIIAIYNQQGTEADVKLPEDNTSIQIIIRGTIDPIAAFERAQTIYNCLHGFDGYFISNGTYIIGCIGQQSGPISLGTDQSGRHEYSINFNLIVSNTNRRN